MKRMGRITAVAALTAVAFAGTAAAEQYQLITGVSPRTSPGAPRPVFSSGGFVAPGSFADGQRLGGTPSATPTSYQGQGTAIFEANEFGSLSYVFKRGSIPAGGPTDKIPFMSIDYLGGPLLDLDGDLNNGSRSLTPVSGQSAAVIPQSSSFIDLGISPDTFSVTLNNFDATGNNAGFAGNTPEQVVTVNNIAGTNPFGVPGSAINPGIDDRQGSLTEVSQGITRIDGLGFEFWQDSIDEFASSPDVLGNGQALGEMRGWLIERDDLGNFPSLAGLLGTTLWSAVNTSEVGNTFNTANGLMGGTATIAGGTTGDDYSVAGNGGLPLTDYTDLGAYLDSVVVPAVDPLSESFVYLEAAGFGMNNGPDPVFGDTVGYDVVLVAQSTPVPEPSSLALLVIGAAALVRRRHG